MKIEQENLIIISPFEYIPFQVNAHVVGAVRPDQATAKLPAMRSRIACSAG